mmetsp:Transcript_24295/g.57199  ORF Transcript_24295/g.57199 Transcript_24295/m.57199 type:complete len:225 (-) Transcript_24295:673-1347(-)
MFIMLRVDGAPLPLLLTMLFAVESSASSDCTLTGNPPRPCAAVLPGGKYDLLLSLKLLSTPLMALYMLPASPFTLLPPPNAKPGNPFSMARLRLSSFDLVDRTCGSSFSRSFSRFCDVMPCSEAIFFRAATTLFKDTRSLDSSPDTCTSNWEHLINNGCRSRQDRSVISSISRHKSLTYFVLDSLIFMSLSSLRVSLSADLASTCLPFAMVELALCRRPSTFDW